MDKITIAPVSAAASGTPASCRKKFSVALLLACGVWAQRKDARDDSK
jgi:hypothetical protein